MHIVITGGAGFLGRRLAQEILHRGSLRNRHGQLEKISKLTLIDVVSADVQDPRVEVKVGDISQSDFLRTSIGPDVDSIFHLAAIVSGQAEADFDLGMRINLDASRALLEICREMRTTPKVVFTSSVAVYGGEMPEIVQDDTALNPKSSYGVQKAIGELLLSDYSRKGFVDGRILRLPTISIRPGKPNQAASSFASGILREPLNGQEAICPVGLATKIWLLSPKFAIDNLIHGHEINSEELGMSRAINLPGLSVTVEAMLEALGQVAGQSVLNRVKVVFDERIDKIVSSWPAAWDDTRAKKLGFRADENFENVIKNYIEHELKGSFVE